MGPLPSMDEPHVGRRLEASDGSGTQGAGTGLACTLQCLAHRSVSQLPLEGSPFPSQPSLWCLGCQGCSSCSRAVLGTLGCILHFARASAGFGQQLPLGGQKPGPPYSL